MLKFQPKDSFSRDQLAGGKALSWLSGITVHCFGRPLKVEAITGSLAADEQDLRAVVQREIVPTRGQELEKLTQENPALRSLLDGLGGRILDEN